MRPLLEICVEDLPGVEAAVEGGADRIELCSALALGGLTPSPAMLFRATRLGLPIHAMVRPRMGDFSLGPRDIALMADDIRLMLDLGAAGIVVGALLPDRTLDCAALETFRKAAGDAVLVLHRAIDLTPHPIAAIEQARQLGFDKVLSSGGARSAPEGAIMLESMVAAAGEHLSVMAGSGVRPGNVAALVGQTGIREVHSSASMAAASPDPDIERFGFGGGRRITDADMVRQLRAALEEKRA
jgi:copper homeostasis protein